MEEWRCSLKRSRKLNKCCPHILHTQFFSSSPLFIGSRWCSRMEEKKFTETLQLHYRDLTSLFCGHPIHQHTLICQFVYTCNQDPPIRGPMLTRYIVYNLEACCRVLGSSVFSVIRDCFLAQSSGNNIFQSLNERPTTFYTFQLHSLTKYRQNNSYEGKRKANSCHQN